MSSKNYMAMKRLNLLFAFSLLAVLVQVIENMEECLLCLGGTRQFLDIINDQYINALVELDEIVELVGSY